MRRPVPLLAGLFAAGLLGAGVLVAAPAGAVTAPVIVLDPGHSRTVHAVDPTTHLDVSDYENEPEMRDVWSVAQRTATALRHDGYRVVLTKNRIDQRRTLAQRAATANRVHAALALSIHTQAGRSGGIGFRAGNNTVYRQTLGRYRVNTRGHRVVFTDRRVATLSRRYAAPFAAARARAQHATVGVKKDAGYDLGSRGLPGGRMWMVQLLAHVPWLYNEAGGNSRGRVGLSSADRAAYARSLVAGVQAVVPVPRPTAAAALLRLDAVRPTAA